MKLMDAQAAPWGGRDLRTTRHVIGKDDAQRVGIEILGISLAGACEGQSSDERHFFFGCGRFPEMASR
jgi:hypothetical protein